MNGLGSDMTTSAGTINPATLDPSGRLCVASLSRYSLLRVVLLGVALAACANLGRLACCSQFSRTPPPSLTPVPVREAPSEVAHRTRTQACRWRKVQWLIRVRGRLGC